MKFLLAVFLALQPVQRRLGVWIVIITGQP